MRSRKECTSTRPRAQVSTCETLPFPNSSRRLGPNLGSANPRPPANGDVVSRPSEIGSKADPNPTVSPTARLSLFWHTLWATKLGSLRINHPLVRCAVVGEWCLVNPNGGYLNDARGRRSWIGPLKVAETLHDVTKTLEAAVSEKDKERMFSAIRKAALQPVKPVNPVPPAVKRAIRVRDWCVENVYGVRLRVGNSRQLTFIPPAVMREAAFAADEQAKARAA